MELRLDIASLVEAECSMKKVVRLCTARWSEIGGSIFEPVKVPLRQWIHYHDYLVELAVRVGLVKRNKKKLRHRTKVFYGEDKMFVSGNASCKSLDLSSWISTSAPYWSTP